MEALNEIYELDEDDSKIVTYLKLKIDLMKPKKVSQNIKKDRLNKAQEQRIYRNEKKAFEDRVAQELKNASLRHQKLNKKPKQKQKKKSLLKHLLKKLKSTEEADAVEVLFQHLG